MGNYSIDANHAKIDAKMPFSSERVSGGAFERVADNLCELLRSSHEPLTISLEAPWGSGKTYFLRRFVHVLEKTQQDGGQTKIKPIIINAWESDYLTDPFEAIIFHFSKEFPKPAADSDFKRTTGIVLKNVAAGLIDQIAERHAGFKVTTGEIFNELDEKYFEKFKERYEEFEKGKVELAEIIEKHLKKEGEIGVVIIDELDRCHPRFAIEFLERIKHFFAIPHLKFVIGVDYEQLCHLVKGAFGEGFDAVNYLNRFFQLRVQLSTAHNGAQDIILNRLLGVLGEKGQSLNVQRHLNDVCALLDQLCPTIRTKQLFATKMALAVRFCNGVQASEWCFVALILHLNENDPKILRRMFFEKVSDEALLLEMTVAFLKYTVTIPGGNIADLDRTWIPLLLIKFFGVEAEKIYATWELNGDHHDIMRDRRVGIWRPMLIGSTGRHIRRDIATIAGAATFASHFNV